jgi:hypothetical protein
MKRVYLLAAVLLLSACAGNDEVEGERVTVDHGVVVDVCGEGNGLPGCRDYATGETYSEELDRKKPPTDKQMSEEAGQIRTETPAELEKTISDLEHDPQYLEDTLPVR